MISKALKWIFIILVLGHIVVIGALSYRGFSEIYQPRQLNETVRDFTIEEGATLNDILERLHEQDLAPAPLYVRANLVWRRTQILVKKGRYQLPPEASTWRLLELFHEGKVALKRFTIPEGLDKWQTADALSEQGLGDSDVFLALIESPELIQDLDPDAEDLEGYLFPETYLVQPEATPEEVVATMVREFQQSTQDLRARLGERGLSLREWVTLASMVERETSVPEERDVVAGVFQNRLDRGMLLQCDPTIIYSLKREGLYKGKIYKSQIRYQSPYNTYVIKGLPPGPIANPGLASLQAAMTPAETPYLYFMAKDDGSHQFSKTLREHNRAVRRWRR